MPSSSSLPCSLGWNRQASTRELKLIGIRVPLVTCDVDHTRSVAPCGPGSVRWYLRSLKFVERDVSNDNGPYGYILDVKANL